MTLNIFAAARQVFQAAKAWTDTRKAEREIAAQHYDPVAAPARGPLLSMLTSGR